MLVLDDYLSPPCAHATHWFKDTKYQDMVFGFLVVLFVLPFGVFLTNYMPTVLKHDFWRTFSSMPFYLILVSPCITVLIKSLYIKVKVYFHFIIQLSVYFCREHLRTAQHSRQCLSSKLMERESLREHHSALHQKRCWRLSCCLFGIHSPKSLPHHWAKPFLQELLWGRDSCREFSFIFWARRWNCRQLVTNRLKCFHLWWQDHHSAQHLRDLRGLFQL